MVTSFYYFDDVTDGRAASVCIRVFCYHSHGLVRVCEKELSHNGKTTEIQIWVLNNNTSLKLRTT